MVSALKRGYAVTLTDPRDPAARNEGSSKGRQKVIQIDRQPVLSVMGQPSQTGISAAGRSGNHGFLTMSPTANLHLRGLTRRQKSEPRKTCLSFLVALHSIHWMRHQFGAIPRRTLLPRRMFGL